MRDPLSILFGSFSLPSLQAKHRLSVSSSTLYHFISHTLSPTIMSSCAHHNHYGERKDFMHSVKNARSKNQLVYFLQSFKLTKALTDLLYFLTFLVFLYIHMP